MPPKYACVPTPEALKLITSETFLLLLSSNFWPLPLIKCMGVALVMKCVPVTGEGKAVLAIYLVTKGVISAVHY